VATAHSGCAHPVIDTGAFVDGTQTSKGQSALVLLCAESCVGIVTGGQAGGGTPRHPIRGVQP